MDIGAKRVNTCILGGIYSLGFGRALYTQVPGLGDWATTSHIINNNLP